MVFILKSTPMVLKKFSLNEFSWMAKTHVNREMDTYRIPDEETTLSDGTVSNQEHLEQEVTITQ